MDSFLKRALKVGLSVLLAGVLYFLWMGVFILLADHAGPLAKVFLWLLAPLATAIGFTVGLLIGNRLLHLASAPIHSILIWPLAGCAVGAGIVYWYGPMLIVYGMFLLGAASMVLREILLGAREEVSGT